MIYTPALLQAASIDGLPGIRWTREDMKDDAD